MLDKEIDERPGAHRLVLAVEVVDEQVGRRQRVLRQHDAQPAAFDVFGEVPFRADQDAVPVQRPPQHDVAVVARQRAVHLRHLAVLALVEPPDAVRVVVLTVQDAAVAR